MTDIQVSWSRIGPLISGSISEEPQSWGRAPAFSVADFGTQQFVDRKLAQLAREREIALAVVHDEFQELLRTLIERGAPRSALHGLIEWGPLSVTRLAGYLGQSRREIGERVTALESLGVIVVADADERGDTRYAVNPEAQVFKGE